jgi:hypothetical protein
VVDLDEVDARRGERAEQPDALEHLGALL